MELPFTESAFLDLFGPYNEALWPVVAGAWLVSLAVVIRAWRSPGAGRSVLVLFRTINPAAVAFAALFVAQAGVFVWTARSHRGRFYFDRSLRANLGLALVGYGFLYPFLGLLFGLEYPRLPLFAVPCPSTLITAGLLLASSGLPRVVYLVPVVWTAIGGSAAVLLGIRADLALLVAGALLALAAVAPRTLANRTSHAAD